VFLRIGGVCVDLGIEDCCHCLHEAHHGSEAGVAARESLVARATHGSVIMLGTRPHSLTVHEEHGGRVDVMP
jgi:hypothetical protein